LSVGAVVLHVLARDLDGWSEVDRL